MGVTAHRAVALFFRTVDNQWFSQIVVKLLNFSLHNLFICSKT